MGRKKKPTKTLEIGAVYFVDRRVASFLLLRKVISRQQSKNVDLKHNATLFRVLPSPTTTSLIVSEHVTYFGKQYAKVLASNSKQDMFIGYILISQLGKIIRGKLKWVVFRAD